MPAQRVKAKKRKTPISKLGNNMLGKLLEEANRDDRAEAQRMLLESLRPVLFELMKNKGWSTRTVARFLRGRNIMVNGAEIDSCLKEIPLANADLSALNALKTMLLKKADMKGSLK